MAAIPQLSTEQMNRAVEIASQIYRLKQELANDLIQIQENLQNETLPSVRVQEHLITVMKRGNRHRKHLKLRLDGFALGLLGCFVSDFAAKLRA